MGAIKKHLCYVYSRLFFENAHQHYIVTLRKQSGHARQLNYAAVTGIYGSNIIVIIGIVLYVIRLFRYV